MANSIQWLYCVQTISWSQRLSTPFRAKNSLNWNSFQSLSSRQTHCDAFRLMLIVNCERNFSSSAWMTGVAFSRYYLYALSIGNAHCFTHASCVPTVQPSIDRNFSSWILSNIYINIGNIANGIFSTSIFRVFLSFPILFYGMTEISTIKLFSHVSLPFFIWFAGSSRRKQSDRWYGIPLFALFSWKYKINKLDTNVTAVAIRQRHINIAFDERDILYWNWINFSRFLFIHSNQHLYAKCKTICQHHHHQHQRK